MKDELKPRDKITQKMTRDGAIAENQTTGETERISNRIRDADLQKTPEQQAAQDAMQLPPVSDTSPLPHAPGTAPKADTGKAERVMERLDAAHTRKTSKKAVRRAQEEAAEQTKSSRLQFTDEELATPELEKYIKKSDKAADRLDKAKAAIPKQKKLVKERTFDEATGKGKTRLHFEEQDKPPGFKEKHNPLSRPAQEAGIFVHNKIHSVEKDNSGVEGAHKTEEAAERGVKYGARKLKQGYRSHKLKPYREAAKAEKAAFKANVNFQYHKTLHDNPQLTSNPLSRFMQKQQIKRQYAKAAKKGGAKAAAEATRKTAKKTAEETRKAAAFAARHPAGILIAVAALLLFIMISAGLSSCGAMFSGLTNGVLGTSYTSEDSDLVATEQNYTAMENALQSEIDNIESTHPGYDEYRYDLDSIGHNPHELASYLLSLIHILRKLDDDNVYRKLQGHWIIEMSEMMATANAKSIEEIKSFLSRQKEVYKIPYETHPADRPRQCVFGGTSNALDFLPLDRSGNRRFIPVMVYPEQAEVHILEDEAASRAYIEQMWAEAMEIYRSGRFKLAFSPAMQRYLKEHQRDFMPEDTKAGI